MTDVRLDRRELLQAGLVLGGAALLPLSARAAHHEGKALPRLTVEAMKKSEFVYVSPLHPDGKESTCHGEVWFFEDGGDVVLATAKDTWKSKALAKGWDKARIWVGDFGRVGSAGERFRAGPDFVATATIDTDRATFDRLMETFATKYADEWGKWKPRFQKSYDGGTRHLIRYKAG